MACLDDTTTFHFIEGKLDPAAEARVREHLDACVLCRTLVSETTKSLRPAPLVPETVGPLPAPTPGEQRIGRYHVLHVLGAGAMGVVYAAYDPELDRQVALKVLRDAPEQFQRTLKREGMTMARLSHENVVAVFDAGTVDGRGFVAMELIQGGSLTRWLERRRRSWREVLDVYVGAGRGLAAAHGAGIVHRDFKPDNVLVGDDGRARVTDFGLARRAPAPGADSARRSSGRIATPGAAPRKTTADTLAGVLIGTPAYMAPQQLRGQPADAASDQFSFCVALYEGLYGHSAFTKSALDERADEALAGHVRDPPRDSRVPAWLHKAIVRGLSPEPSARHPSMADLLAALEKTSWRVRRRVIIPVAIACAVLAAFLGYGKASRDRGAVCQGAEASLTGVWDAPRKQEVEAAFLGTRAPYARDSWARTKRLLDNDAHGWTTMRTEACEATRLRGEQSEELLDLREGCLDDHLRALAALTKLFASADEKIVENSVEAVHALPSLDRCANATALHSGIRPPTDETTARAVESLRGELARVAALERAGKYKDALASAEPLIARTREIKYLPVEAEALYELGTVEGRLENSKAAEATLEEAAAVAEAASHHEIAARAWIDLAYFIGYRQVRFESGYRWIRYAQAAIEHMGGSDELEGERIERLGLLQWSEGKSADALSNLERAQKLFEERPGKNQIAVAKTLDAIAGVQFDLGHYDRACDLQTRAVAIDESVVGPLHPWVSVLSNNLANSLWKLGRYEEALTAARRALDIIEKTVGPDASDASLALDTIGGVLTSLRRNDEAHAAFKRARAIIEHDGEASHPDYAAILNHLGELDRQRQMFDDALLVHRQALGILEPALGKQHPDVAMTHYLMGEVLLAEGKFRDALAEDEGALSVVETARGGSSSNAADLLTAIGEAHLGLNDPVAAESSLEKALEARGKCSGEPTRLARTRFALARSLWETGDRPRACELARQARESYATGNSDRPELQQAQKWLAARPACPGEKPPAPTQSAQLQ